MAFWLCIPHEKSEAYLRKNCPSNPPFESIWDLFPNHVISRVWLYVSTSKMFRNSFFVGGLVEAQSNHTIGDLWGSKMASKCSNFHPAMLYHPNSLGPNFLFECFVMLRTHMLHVWNHYLIYHKFEPNVGKYFICGAYNGTNYQLLQGTVAIGPGQNAMAMPEALRKPWWIVMILVSLAWWMGWYHKSGS